MRFRVTLIQKYTLVSAVFVLALVLGLGSLISGELSKSMLERDGQLTAEFVRAQAREHLGPADFTAEAPGQFARVFREISKIREILQLNVFDRDGTVLWSSEPSLIGKRFPGKGDLQEAFAGRLVAEVTKGKPESLRGPGVPSSLVELYVPLSFEGGAVVGVLETYKAPVLLDNIRRAILVTWGLVALGGGLLYVSLLWLVRRVWVSHIASEESLKERNRELGLVSSRLETLARLNQAVLASLEPANVFNLVVQSAINLLPAVSLARLWLLEGGTETLSLAAAAGEPLALPINTRLHFRDSLIGWILTSGKKAHSCPDVLQEPRWKSVEWARQEGIVSYAGIPIRSDSRPLGVLSVFARRAHEFAPDELELLTSLAASAAVAIENARLFTQVQRGQAEWQETFDAIGDSVILVSPRYEVMRVNLAGAAIVGMTPQDLMGRPCCEFFCGRPDPRPDCPVAEALRSGRSAAVEVVSANGDTRTFQVRSYPVSGGRGGIEAVVEHRRDITELKEAEERLIQVEKLRSLGELAGGVAHGFNNVLAVIMGRADLLAASLEGGLDAERLRRSLKIIKRAAGDGAAIIRRVQDFARVKRAGDFAPFDLNAVVQEAVEFTRPRWADESQARGIEITVDHDLAAVPLAEGNVAEVREVLTNMILNAVDAMPQGGTITLKSWLKGSQVCFAVNDTGIGMTEDVRRRIFDPFFTTKGTKGTGLGLSVTYGIIQRHGGEIRAESAPGRGSTFTVSLPVAQKPPATAPEPRPEVARQARILLIDDEEDLLETLNEILVSAGHTVSTAGSGDAGIAAFRQGEFDLVLSDLGMPGMSGWEVARKIRELDPTVPVVLITGWGEQVDSEQLRQSGVARAVAKPLEMEGLLRIVSDALRARTGP